MAKSPMKSLSRIKKFAIDDMRKQLAVLLTEEDKLEARLAQMGEELAREKALAKNDIEALKGFGIYLKKHLEDKEKINQRLATLRREIDEAKDALIEAYKEQKTYDIVDENRERAEAKAQDAKTQAALDEIGTNTYIKRKKNGD